MKKIIFLSAILSALLIIGIAKSAENNATLTLQKDKGTGLFILNMRDSQGIRSFSLVFPTDKLPYSGDLSGCPASRKIDNIAIDDPSDFTPLMNAVILDCQGNETEFEISAPKNGVAQVKKVGIEPPLPPPPTPPPPASSSQSGTTQSKPAPSGAPSEGRSTDSLANLKYPVKELGNCENKEACKTYCEVSANLDRCIAFAEENGLLKHAEIERGKKFSEIVKSGGGPGECKTERACFDYCNNVDQIDACVAFAEKNGFMEGKELDEAKKIQSIVKSGKSLPGNCKNRTACEAYCKNTEHLDECIAFAKENGMMSEEEIKEVEKFLPLMKSGQTPGGCKSREECDAFCNADDHFEECFNFADKAGLITDKERDIMKKTGGKGPGGCRGRACQTFCENLANQKACFEFGKEYGLISEEDLARMEEGKKMLKEQLETGPPEIQECLKSVVDVNVLESEGFAGGPELGEKMKECFEKMIPEGMKGKFEFGERGEFHGPGGCKSREECEAYCQANPEACGIKIPRGDEHGEFDSGGPPAGGGGFSGPGGCKSREECEAYCKSNPEACGFGGRGGSPGGEEPGGNFQRDDHGSEECVKQGGNWNGTTCNFPGSDRGTEECTKQGGNWDGKTCNFPQIDRGAEECTKQGGNWDGKTCNFPNSQQYQQQYQQPPAIDYQKQYEEQYRKQYEEQFKQQYEQQLQQQPSPQPASSNARVYLKPLTQYGSDKYSIVVEDMDGVKEFSVTGAGGEGLYGGGYNTYRACNDGENLSRPSGTVTIPTSYFPLKSKITDCNGNSTEHSVTQSNIQSRAQSPFAMLLWPILQLLK